VKQLLQHIRSGVAVVTEIPAPNMQHDQILVRNATSLVSAGTERMVVDFAEKSLLDKARSRPDLVRQTLDKAQREGILTTLETVQSRLGQPMALGYSSAGVVLSVGASVNGFQIGDRVACAGGGYAAHAEVVTVPTNLAVKLPDGVDFESAAFATLAAIAMQGIRLAEVKLGEFVAVVGLGLLGQLAVQMLKAAGCTVIGTDIQPQRTDLARQMGADAASASVEAFRTLVADASSGHGADSVLITADTKSNQPVELAGDVARKKGIVVAVGAVGMNIPRKVYYEKELDFRISSSYGPGRYDTDYEEKGRDYPYAYVRWTENRNMQAFVQLVATGAVKIHPLVTHRFPIDDAPTAYELITGKKDEPFLGVLLTYPEEPDLSDKIVLRTVHGKQQSNADHLQAIRLGVLGAGKYAHATLLPALKDMDGIVLQGIASSGGVSARTAAEKFKFGYCTTDSQTILQDPDINTVAILTRHNFHAPQVIAALEANKNVFVEKPLCLSQKELEAVVSAYNRAQAPAPDLHASPPYLMVGFNRRFAPFIVELKQKLKTVAEPLLLHYRANAGYIPPDHWTQDPEIGGGRLLGEACHFIDLVMFLAGSRVTRVSTHALPDAGRYRQDNLVIQLQFDNGSLGTVTYAANGDRGLGKEFLEVFGGGLSARMEDYRTLAIRNGRERIKRTARMRQDKGHNGEWQALVSYLQGAGPEPISFAETVQSTAITLAAQRSLQEANIVVLQENDWP
jgi:predicted dehydrogenase/threonine dehydrogenase-like Zn-dependent dehydrogenase